MRRHLLSIATLGLLVAGILPFSSVSALELSPTPIVLQNVPLADVIANKNGICDGGFTHVIHTVSGPANAVNYLNAAQSCGLKVIYSFPDTINYAKGAVYPRKAASWINLVKGHPALFGYLTVKEPSWNHISGAEIRSLYTAFHAADPDHPVLALLGDIPHFDRKVNPWTAGMADILMVDWYPVETARGGCSRTGTHYIPTGPAHFVKVRSRVARDTPGTPIWLMAQTHKNLMPRCHKKQGPTEAQLRRQVREGRAYLGATGFAFHTWSNTNYARDQRRSPSTVRVMRAIADEIHGGWFR